MGKRSSFLISFIAFTAIILLSGAIVFMNLDSVTDVISRSSGQEYRAKYIQVDRILYDSEGNKVISKATLNEGGADRLHLIAEAAILPPEDGSGLFTCIPEDIRLIGISEKDGYIYAEYSGDISANDRKALEQIEESIRLSIDFRELDFIINGSLI